MESVYSPQASANDQAIKLLSGRLAKAAVNLIMRAISSTNVTIGRGRRGSSHGGGDTEELALKGVKDDTLFKNDQEAMLSTVPAFCTHARPCLGFGSPCMGLGTVTNGCFCRGNWDNEV